MQLLGPYLLFHDVLLHLWLLLALLVHERTSNRSDATTVIFQGMLFAIVDGRSELIVFSE